MNTTDWEIHRLERAAVRLQSAETVDNGLPEVPTVEAILGIANGAGEFEWERKQALADIESVLYRKKAGRAGEEAVEQTLTEIVFPEGSRVFRNVSLLIRKGYRIEIDVLILTPSFALILEVKNIAGTLSFNEEEGKTVRIRENGEIDEFDCYVHQLDRQISGLNQFLAIHRITLPVHGAIVLSNQNTVIKKRPETLPLIYRKQLARYFRRLQTADLTLSETAAHQLFGLIGIRAMSADEQPLCTEMNLNPLMFRRGVLCLGCNQRIQAYQGRGWYCRKCKLPGREAVRQSVEDRLILIGPEITNKQCREFLMIGHRAQATRILKSLSLTKLGEPPGTVYRKLGSGRLEWAES
ncbi:Nuclease-related domain-containing protein [Bhargavaea ginsengi]|uniref:Nuclease-related domain-containing protein n=1 Tax=Bhargavaea ginsengi TaxID=426757 RepID=A0A1H7AR18_9BACL|nr:nuclease-related domain-containing protein [Bhargavaea ginsengi]MCM3087220.1 NERD domain-containing protein [Bhargavaea ginsengi]SEJ63455.1 Nuclease-related domain-containing protein [Bhargavaea ginsengi]